MASTLTRNLKLRVDSNLTPNAKYNLQKIDDLASIYTVDQTDSVNVRAKTDINLLPEDSASGGSGMGGTVNLGTASQYADEINLYGTTVFLGKQASLLDVAVSGTRRLLLEYNSTLNGSVDTGADRKLSIDMEGGDRSLVLAENLSILGGFAMIQRTTAATDVTFPTTGTLATLAGVETLSNKTIDSYANTITNINNSNVALNAAIAYSKLNLALSIVNADVANGAAIDYDKLELTGRILETDFSPAIVIPYSAIDLTNSIMNADVNTSAAISYTKLALTNQVVNTDIAPGAGIAGTKITPDFGNQEVIGNKLSMRGPSFKTSFVAVGSGQTNDLVNVMPADHGPGVLSNDGFGALTWAAISGTGTVTSVALALPASIFSVSGSPITASGTLTGSLLNQSANTVWAGPTSGGAAAPTFRALVVADVPTGIPATSIGIGTVDNTELNYLDGATSNIQTQLNGLQPLDSDLTAIAALAANGLISRTGSGTMAVRTITPAAAYISIANGDGVAGNPTVDLSITSATSTTPANNDEILVYDVSASAHRKIQISDITSLGGGSFAQDWTSGTSIAVTHNLSSRDVIVQLYDNTTFETVEVDTVIRNTINQVTLTASVAASGAGWRVLIKKI